MMTVSNRLRQAARTAVTCALLTASPALADDTDFSEPWKRADRALVVDAYEYNQVDWTALASDTRIAGFINKASDGLSPPYFCTGTETEQKLCKALWRRHAVARELFHTRRTVAKALGLKWGAYHLARPGNPIDQANHFIDFADPQPDDLLAIDIEENDPEKWMSLEDAEIFVRHLQQRIGRFPVLYTNGVTAKHIADHRASYPLLSRLPLWYARYKPEIGVHFPKGNWEGYALWQFSSQANCNTRRCPYRVKGTDNDIDVNVAAMDASELRAAWPFGGLVDPTIDLIASVPLPVDRQTALAGDVTIAFARVSHPVDMAMLLAAQRIAGNRYPRPAQEPANVVVASTTALDFGFTGSIDGVTRAARAAFKIWMDSHAALASASAAPVAVRTGVPTAP